MTKNQREFDIESYQALRAPAIDEVCDKFYQRYPQLLETFGERGVKATRQDIGYTLDFLRPALEFGQLQPFTDYLAWLAEVLTSRGVAVGMVQDMLEWLAQFFAARAPKELGALAAGALRESMAALQVRIAGESPIDRCMPEAWPDTLPMEQALLAGDLERARAIVKAQRAAGNSILDIEIHLIQTALYQVGRDWQQNKVTVAQEHLATSTAIALMAAEFDAHDIGEANGKSVICACIEGNNHEVGLRILADAFTVNGWDVIYLGRNCPVADLMQSVRDSAPNLVCLSISMADQLPTARWVINQLRSTLGGQGPAIMIGGLAVNAHPPISGELGADLTAPDARSAILSAA